MKKFTLMAAVAAFVMTPGFAHAGKNGERSWFKKDTYERTSVQTRDGDNSDFKVRVNTTEGMKAPQNYRLTDRGEEIRIEGEKIYIVADNGYKYFAPNGPYTAQNGMTFVAEDGLVIRTEAPDQMVYVDADAIDSDNDGYTNSVRVDTQTRRVR